MFVVEAVDPDNIICQVGDSSSELTELMKYLEESYKGKFHRLKQSCQKSKSTEAAVIFVGLLPIYIAVLRHSIT